MNNQELYNEEQRQILLDLKKAVDNQAKIIEKQNELIQKQLDTYVAPKDNIEVKGKLEVNTEKEVAITNLDEHTQKVVEAVLSTIQTPVDKVTVKNIKDAVAKSIKVSNLEGVENKLVDLKTAIEKQEAINIVQKEVKMPNTASDYVSVRLTDGKSFYNAITKLATAIQQLPLVISQETGNYVVAVANADGSMISGVAPVDNLLLETGDDLLLETGDLLLTE